MIAGFFDVARGSGSPVPKVRVGVFVPNVTQAWAAVDFLIDTGAATTCVHPVDATTRLHILTADLNQPLKWARSESYRGIGGSAIYYVVPAHYAFQHGEGRVQVLHGQLRIAQPRPHNQALESLLGWDLLQHFRLVTDWPSRQIELHEIRLPQPLP